MTDAIPDAELDVLSCLWRLKQGTAKAIRLQLEPTRPLNHASVCTLLRRLERRGMVARERPPDSREYCYRPLVPPSKTRRNLLSQFVRRAFDGSGIELVSTLFQAQPPSAEEIEQLQELIDRWRSDQRRRKRNQGES